MATRKRSAKPSGGKRRTAKASSGISAKTYSGLNKKRMEQKGGGGGDRVILEKGTTVPVQFLQTPKEMKEWDEHVWQEGGNWYFVPCAGDDCEPCEDEDKRKSKKSYKFAANVYNLKERKVQVLEGPKSLATQIFYRYKRKPGAFLKRVFDITKFPTNPVTYNFELAEESPIRTSGLKLIDLDEHIQNALDRYYGDADTRAEKSALDDDDDEYDEDDFDEDDEDEDYEEDDDDYEEDDEDEVDDEEPDEDEMMDKDVWDWSDLKDYADELGVKKKTKKRSELVAAIVKKRGY